MNRRPVIRDEALLADLRSRVLIHLYVIFAVVIGGTIAFSLVDGQSVVDSFYFIIMVLTLIGANNPHTVGGEVIGIVVALISVTVILSFLTQVLGPAALDTYREHRARRASRMENHIVICGSSDTARVLLNRLRRDDVLVVVKDRPTYEALSEKGLTVLLGDYETSEVLRRAGVAECRALVAASQEDSENAFICLTSKKIAERVPVFATVTSQENVEKLQEVKADHIISPALLSAEAILKGLGPSNAGMP